MGVGIEQYYAQQDYWARFAELHKERQFQWWFREDPSVLPTFEPPHVRLREVLRVNGAGAAALGVWAILFGMLAVLFFILRTRNTV
jgi:hypothetical protein